MRGLVALVRKFQSDSARCSTTGRCQVVVAPLMMVSSISVGVCPFKTSRGRPLSWSWAARTWASVTLLKLVPLGKYSRISPLVFSLVGR